MPKSLLEKLEAALGGPIVAWDHKYVVWFKTENPNRVFGSVDLRDIATKIKGATFKTLQEVIPAFDKPKRAKVAINSDEE